MASVNLTLCAEFKPAYHALLSCAEAIAAERGYDEAFRWAEKNLVEDFDLFCRVTTDSRPSLRLIQGGR